MPDSDVLDPPPELFGSDLAHLFDYCRTLLGQDAQAIRTARSVLDAAQEPLPDRERHRAWLFGLARSLALALRPPGKDEPSYLPSALTAESSQQTDKGVLQAFRALTDRDREILDLVYRHHIRPADLAALLIVPGQEVYRCLVHAEEEFLSLAAGPDAGQSARLEDIAALPLAAPPVAAPPVAARPAAALPLAALPPAAVPAAAVPAATLPTADGEVRRLQDPCRRR